MLQPIWDRDRSKRRRATAQHDVDDRVRSEVLGIALLAIALLSIVALMAPEGALLAWWHDGLRATLGWGAYVTPVPLVALGLGVWVESLRPRLGAALIAVALGAFVVLGLAQHYQSVDPASGDSAGGFVGAAIAGAFHSVLGAVGTPIALGALLLACVVVAANRPLGDLVPPFGRLRDRFAAGDILPGRSARIDDDEDEHPVKINAPRPRQRVVEEAAGTARDAKDEPEKPKLRVITPAVDETAPLNAKKVEPPQLFEPDETAPLDARSANSAMPVTPSAEAGAGVLGASGKQWALPPIDLLEEGSAARHGQEEIRHNIRVIEETLAHFSIAAKVVEVNVGPVVTRYELKPSPGVKLSRIEALADDLALALAARSLRIEAPVPGKSVVGIEIPNLAIGLVSVRDVVSSALFKASGSKLAVALGRDIAGAPVLADLGKLPHLLVAGQTGSGKSVCINAIITSLLLGATPDEVRLLLIDPKRVELTNYNGVPHLLVPVITDHDKILTALRWATGEMDRRYRLFAQNAARNIERYNENRTAAEKIPYIVIIIDELADLMMLAPIDVEEAITRIAQLARATGIHLVIATQRPSVEVITGLIKANIPARIAFAMASSIDSRTILDMTGAEKLLGRGDMLFLPPDQAKPVRAQGVYVSDRELDRVTDFWRKQGQPEYQLAILEAPMKKKGGDDGEGEEIGDALFKDAVRVVTQFDRASASLLQRRLRIGYARAARLMDILEERGVVGPGEGAKPREVLITDARAYLGDDEEDEES